MFELTLEDKERIAKAWVIAFVVTSSMFASLFFIQLGRSTPKVPPLELFVEVNYGTDKVGSGNIQTFNKASDSKDMENKRPESVSKVEEKVATKPVTAPTPTPPTPVKTTPTKTVTQPTITSKAESPVEAPKSEEASKPSKTTTPSTTPTSEKAKPAEPKINEGALFKKSSGTQAGGNGTTGTGTGTGGNNNGDDKSGVGDKGVKDGSLFAKTYKGTGGGGGTAVGLDLKGWSWNKRPVVEDNSDATGEITFKIVVDNRGKVKNVITHKSTVTDYAVVNKYRDAIRLLTFTASSANVPDESTGFITFKITAK
jgi:outer membrane biosynthesis protein TonB